MSVIESFYNKTFSVSRRATGTGANSRTSIYGVVSSGNRGCLRPSTITAQPMDKAIFGYEYFLYCDNAVDVRVADVITIDSFEYNVKGVSFYEDEEDGAESHRKVTLYKANNNDAPTNP